MDKINLSIINDEVSNDIKKAINFCIENKLKFIDIRTINGKNIVNLSEREISELKLNLQQAGILVSGISSPLFKWFQHAESNNNFTEFGVSGTVSDEEKIRMIDKSLQCAIELKAQYLRIFSGLRMQEECDPLFFQKEITLYNRLVNLCRESEIELLIENEPVCNIHSMRDLINFREYVKEDYINILLDIGNLYSCEGEFSKEDLISSLPNISGNIHLKDFSIKKEEFCILGQGDIPYSEILKTFMDNHNKKKIFLTIETHCKDGSLESLNNLKKLLHNLNLQYQ
jgi:sugar phosphate isomerase/epimerase